MKNKVLALNLAAVLLLAACSMDSSVPSVPEKTAAPPTYSLSPASGESAAPLATAVSLSDLPPYSGQAYIPVNDNVPYFTAEDSTTASFEEYSDLDALGRCGVTYACVGQDIMPTEERGSIGSVKPTGWQTVKYDFVEGKYLYNRCHLIGFQLTGENANKQNLITGTRYLNIEGMLPFENMVADYVKETGNHVLYRVTPYYEGEDLVAQGVLMEGYSVEDEGEGILYNVFCYNVQPGVVIDYATGDSCEGDPTAGAASTAAQDTAVTYILNTSSMKFHSPSCPSAEKIDPQNREESSQGREDLISAGYSPCGSCKP